jgi:hypothetical protein
LTKKAAGKNKKKKQVKPAPAVESQDISQEERIRQLLLPKKQLSIQKSIKFDRDLFEAAVALCWYKRRTFTPWVKKLVADTVAKEFVEAKTGMELHQLILNFRQAAMNDPEIADVLVGLYLKEVR